ncbi:hypothetical protein LUZ63_015981 [Rhynchospora breviuscula]|uniref:Ankyrin n=1 Tax=Rhynchospora breviuscula TaxID=2022672 RepID=A0A9Q0HMK5_9POAL|nr:hypothetical protein LUZ63_015981 [Rhynchospora breviuscula]
MVQNVGLLKDDMSSVAEMRMLRWICGHTRRDRIKNYDIRDMVGVAPIEEKLTQHRLRWFGHIQRRPSEAPVRSEILNHFENTRKGETSLFHAAMGGHAVTAMYLIAHGADPVIPDKEGSTPLHWQPKLVKFLLSSGVPVDIEFDRVTCTPLATAALHGQARDEYTPLFYSVTIGSLECTKLLIKAGADVNLKCPLRVAAQMGLIEIIMCLLEAGADPNLRNDYGWLPIEVAAMSKKMDIVEMLFPLTSPVPEVHDWSVQGILQYADSYAFYQKVINLDSAEESGDAALFSNRSLCWQRMGEGGQALKDALMAQRLRPEWPKAHYRVGAAMMLLEVEKKNRT